MNRARITTLLVINTIAICRGELLAYEPFDDQPHHEDRRFDRFASF